MEALVKFGREDKQVEIRNIAQPPDPGPGEVVVDVRAAGVCGSDLHMWRDHQSWTIKLPLVLGHEFCGVVAAVGAAVTGFQAGDRVAVETAAEICESCVFCHAGDYNQCPHRLGYGALYDGAFTRFVTARQGILHHIPANVPFEYAALTEPICVAYNALVEKTPALRPGDTVVIQGPGPIGMMALFVAKLRGASEIIMLGTDVDKQRLGIAEQIGATRTLNIDEGDPIDLVRSLGDGYGADLIVDCTGVSIALQSALEMVRPNGVITKIGWGPQPLNFNLDSLVQKAVTLQGSFSHLYSTWERALGLLSSGQIDLELIIGGVYPLGDWVEAFEEMEAGNNVKSVLLPA
ncbi:MAG: zinc-binding dehydrogenase [Chloroflexi bacterium]|nr:zinc-binding dehydrogenase [Chloroflexota bacterium]